MFTCKWGLHSLRPPVDAPGEKCVNNCKLVSFIGSVFCYQHRVVPTWPPDWRSHRSNSWPRRQQQQRPADTNICCSYFCHRLADLSYSGQVMRNIWISICVTVIAVFLITDFDQILQILKYCFVIFSISFCIIGTVVLTVLVNILTSPKVTLNRF